MTALLCRHCGAAPISRPRRLCWNCYYAPAIRALYPSANPFVAASGAGVETYSRPLPPHPTAARPGSPEKVAVLIQRAAQGLQLFHPNDAVINRPCRRRAHICRVG